MRLNLLHLATRTAQLTALGVLAAALAGCQSIAGTQQFTQVRVIAVSPDAPALDIYQNSAIFQNSSQSTPAGLYNIGFGTVSSYIPVAAGAYTHAAFTAGTQQQLAQVRGTFATGSQYTVLAGNIAASLQMTVLRDQSTPAPSGQVALRFLGQATRAGAIDIYLLPAGFSLAGASPIAAGIAFGSNTGYINAPSGIYSLVAFPAGALPAISTPAYTGTQATYPATSARTIILLDQQPAQQATQPPATPSLQIITADDYDSPSAS